MLRWLEHQHSVGKRTGFIDIVGDQQHRNPAMMQINKQIADSCARHLIQARRRLIQQQHIRMAGNDPCDGGKPLLPTGKTEWGTVAQLTDMQQFQRFIDTLCDFLLGKSQITRTVCDILGNRVREQLPLRMLHDQAETVPQLDPLLA